MFHCIYTLFVFVAGVPTVTQVPEEDDKYMVDDGVPNTLLLEPSHVDTVSLASYHTAVTTDKGPKHPAKVNS